MASAYFLSLWNSCSACSNKAWVFSPSSSEMTVAPGGILNSKNSAGNGTAVSFRLCAHKNSLEGRRIILFDLDAARKCCSGSPERYHVFGLPWPISFTALLGLPSYETKEGFVMTSLSTPRARGKNEFSG